MSTANLFKLGVSLAAAAFWAASLPATAAVFVQCPGDVNGDAIPDSPGDPNVVCKHLTAGDGFGHDE